MIDTAVTIHKSISFTEKTETPVDRPLIWARKFRKDLHTLGKVGMGYKVENLKEQMMK